MDLTFTSSPLSLAVILASKGLGAYLRQHFLDKTFQGLYQVNAFDLALLIPYFIVLIILAAYGAHRYWMVYLYYKHKKNKTTEPAGHFDECPASPCSCRSSTSNTSSTGCSTPCAVSTIRKISSTSNCSTTRPTKPSRSRAFWWSATPRLGHPVKYLHRDNREGFKAGALGRRIENGQGRVRRDL